MFLGKYLHLLNFISIPKVLASPTDILSGSSRNPSSPHERLLQPVAVEVDVRGERNDCVTNH